MPARKKVIRDEWPRVYWTPKDGQMVLCVDSRKTGFAKGGRKFWHTVPEALAHAEQIARTKDNEGAAGFAELSPPTPGCGSGYSASGRCGEPAGRRDPVCA